MGKTDKTAKTTFKFHHHVRALLRPPHGYWIVCSLLLAVSAVVAVLYFQYHDRALPNVYIGTKSVANLSANQIKSAVVQEAAQLKVTFSDGAQTITAGAADLGVTVNVDATAQQALLARRGQNIGQNLQLWQPDQVPLVYSNDAGVLKKFIVAHFPKFYVDPQDAQVVFNDKTNLFEVKPSVPGKGFDIKAFESALPDLAKNPRTTVLPMQSVAVAPLISDQSAAATRDYVNNIIKLDIKFTQDGGDVYQASPADIASWAVFTPDTVAGKYNVSFDRSHVLQFLNDQIAAKITQLPVDKKVVVDSSTGQQIVLQQGRTGYQLQEIDKLADAVMNAVNTNTPLDQAVVVEEAPFKTVTVTGTGKWIEVDLTHQTATMYLGNQVIDTFLISSGRAATPTEVGTFAIYRKLPMDTMTGVILGEYYYVPDIPWVSYFDGGEAFHGTYWHHNFGHPMSHGCINMRIPDAKILYDYAPVGTKVVVHY